MEAQELIKILQAVEPKTWITFSIDKQLAKQFAKVQLNAGEVLEYLTYGGKITYTHEEDSEDAFLDISLDQCNWGPEGLKRQAEDFDNKYPELK